MKVFQVTPIAYIYITTKWAGYVFFRIDGDRYLVKPFLRSLKELIERKPEWIAK